MPAADPVSPTCSDAYPGALVISIDFEMRWGMHHVLGPNQDAYRESLHRAPHVVDCLLREFAERGIRATWATVGAIACDGWDEYWERVPAPPRYDDPRLAVTKESERVDPSGQLHFSRKSVESIVRTLGQDLGCHTFSHALCGRQGATSEDMRADLSACARLWQEKFGITQTSFVYPCNEVCYVDHIVAAGFQVARAPAGNRWEGSPRKWELLRLLSECGIPKSQPWPVDASGIRWTQGSAFVRFNLPKGLWDLHVGLLRMGLRRLRPGRLMHLWWHPHNLGHDPERCLRRLRPLLDDISEALEDGRLRSLNMGDLGL